MSAFLRVRNLHTREIVHSVEITDLSRNHVERVMMGMLHNMNTDDYFIDDSEVDTECKRQEHGRKT